MAGIAIGAAVIGAGASMYASNEAASTQAGAARAAGAMSQQQYQQTRQDQMPYMQAGYQALDRMQDPKYQQKFSMADYQADPGAAFRQAEAQKALDRSASARGMSLSGAQIKATTRFNSDYASNEYNNAYNRFNNDMTTLFNRDASIAGLGQTANGTTANAGANNVANQTNAIMGAANASSAATMAGANAIAGGINSAANNWMGYQAMNKFAPQYGSGGADPWAGAGLGSGPRASYGNPSIGAK